MSSVTAVVVHHSGRELLAQCLASLRVAAPAVEVLVVDNGSSDGSRELLRGSFPEVLVVELGENRGFAGGLRAGVRAAGGEWVLTLNDDATVEPDAIARLLDAVRGATGVFSAAAQMRFASNPGVINSAGIGVDRLGVAYDRLLGEPVEAGGLYPVEVFGACAGAALYDRAKLVELTVDESFHAYLEDVDLAWRARMRGWRSLYVPAAIVHHHHSATSGHGSSLKHFLVGRNRVRLLAKNMDGHHLRRSMVPILLHELAYVAYAVVADRTLAPVRGRLAGARDWRRLRRSHAPGRRAVELEPPAGLRCALARRRAWKAWSSGQDSGRA